MSKSIYDRPIAFALLAAAVILVGTMATLFLPMFSEQMHPKLENLKPFTPLQLAGRDVYQRESCMGCHTQTVRPLKSEVMRYGEYSKAGEFAYDRPHLWGSKRTGPDLARVGGKYPDSWHYTHFETPEVIAPGSNMPVYGWLKDNAVDAASMESHMKALSLPYTKEDMDALSGKSELDALVAYLQSLGHAVRPEVAEAAVSIPDLANPFAGDKEAYEKGEHAFESTCMPCHGDHGKGGIGPALNDTVWLGMQGDITDAAILTIISGGTQAGMDFMGHKANGGMPPYAGQMSQDEIWQLVSYIRHLQEEHAAEGDDDAKSGAGVESHSPAESFATLCAACHGANAKGGFGPDLTDDIWLGVKGDISDDKLVGIITSGTEAGMPSFKGKLSDDAMRDLVKHIRSLD